MFWFIQNHYRDKVINSFESYKMFLSLIPKLKSIIGDGEKSTASLHSPPSDDLTRTVTDKGGKMTNLSDQSNDFKELIYDYIKGIKDPEKPATLEDLHVVYEEGVKVETLLSGYGKVVRIEFNPTVPHCTLATLIGLCIRVRLERTLGCNEHFKLDIYIKKGTHNTEDEINKQINDKERIAAAMENPNLRKIVEECIQEED